VLSFIEIAQAVHELYRVSKICPDERMIAADGRPENIMPSGVEGIKIGTFGVQGTFKLTALGLTTLQQVISLLDSPLFT